MTTFDIEQLAEKLRARAGSSPPADAKSGHATRPTASPAGIISASPASPTDTAFAVAATKTVERVRTWLDKQQIEYRPREKTEHLRWIFEFRHCVFHPPGHPDADGHEYECCITVAEDGKLGASCKHDSERGWREFKKNIGGWASTRAPKASTADGVDNQMRDDRPKILVTTDIMDVTNKAEAALLGQSQAAFTRSALLVRIIRDGAKEIPGLCRPLGASVIAPLPDARLRELLAVAAVWLKQTDDGPERILPPSWVVDTLMARGEWPLPPLEGITETPMLRADGSILEQPGYDATTGLYFEPPVIAFPKVPSEPTTREVHQALEDLLQPFNDFPFLALADATVVLAATFSILARPAIIGPVPLFAFLAHTPGSGKSLLVDLITTIATGRIASRMIAPKEDDEAKKRLIAIGIEGTPTVLLDNVEGAFGSASLAAALTGEALTDRLLGYSRIVTVVLRSVWMLTGNNVTFRGDLGRRVVPCTIDPRCEHPEDRAGFEIDDVRQFVRDARPRLVTAALTLLRAFHVAGRPKHGKPRKGSFESWDDLVRAAVIWLTGEDPLAGCEQIRRDGDSDLTALRGVLLAWEGCFSDQPITLAKAVSRAMWGLADDSPEATLKAAFGALGCAVDPANLSVYFRRLKGRIVDGRVLQNAGDEKGSAKWRVVRV